MQVDRTDGAPKRRVRDTRVLECKYPKAYLAAIYLFRAQNNHINFCAPRGPRTNGLQINEGSCNGIPMGAIPSVDNMVSSIILTPAPDDIVRVNKPIEFRIRVTNLATGYFTNPAETYFAAPQLVNEKGLIEGHLHVTVQFLGDKINPQTPLDASNPIWFKGIRNKANGDGILSATLDKGLEKPGFYRVCTMAAAANHQPVLMPVAARGAQDDCTKFRVKW
ncbi:hypothetical protein PAAG_06646 [Paracoccidioides lutzii Pb01]|uniref:Uncharacterized protein n=1 Tax=Paracoccidioides lutzii (strain ATCC MYA-826 / Pb01) TaxID=502779 RepID=C1H7A5_PARBA|nr:hypothetical protein PAAG_06646 [Paracoccidioides lutzii Pb01]EEH35599.2 hypothetical protein PAAG_06646 [Paracoccidioides lutzii Pb01]